MKLKIVLSFFVQPIAFSFELRWKLLNFFDEGFKEGKGACCGTGKFRGVFSCGGKRLVNKEFQLCKNPNEHVFWDSYHLTERLHKQLADQMWSGESKGNRVGPYNLRDLFQSL